MADGSGGGGGAALGVLVGGLVVVVAVMGVMMFSNGGFSPTKNVNVNIHPPTISAPGK